MKRALLLLFAGVLAIAQNPGTDVSAYYRMTGQAPDLVKYPNSGGYPYRWLHVAPPLVVDATNPDYPVLKLPGNFFSFDFVKVLDSNGNVIQISIDKSTISYRSPIITPVNAATNPITPGQCQIGTAGWSADSTGLYYCVRNPDAGTLQATPFVWAQPNRFSAPDPANPGKWIWQSIP